MIKALEKALMSGSTAVHFLLDFTSYFFLGGRDADLLADVKRLESRGLEIYRLARLVHTTSASIPFPQCEFSNVVIRANTKACRPLLALGIDGNRNAQKSYERERLASVNSMPAWLKESCQSISRAELERLTGKQIKGNGGFSFRLQPQNQQRVGGAASDLVFVDFFNTTLERKVFFAEAQSDLFSDHPKKCLSDGRQLHFSPVSNDLAGNAARIAFKKATTFILTTRLVLDIVDLLGVSLAENEIKTIVKSNLSDPWKLSTNFCIKNMLLVSDILESRKNFPDTDEKNQLLRQCLTKSPSLFLPELMIRSNPKAIPAASNSKVINRSVPLSNDEESGSKLRNTVIDSILGQIKEHNRTEARAQARELYKAIKKGATNYDLVMTGLRRGRQAGEILSDIVGSALSKSAPQRSLSDSSPVSCEVVPLNPNTLPKTEISWNVELSEKFLAWYNGTHDKLTRGAVDRRLERLKIGNPGYSKQVRGGVIELKEGRIRIYLRKVSNEHYLVINAGDKSTQDSDIEECQFL